MMNLAKMGLVLGLLGAVLVAWKGTLLELPDLDAVVQAGSWSGYRVWVEATGGVVEVRTKYWWGGLIGSGFLLQLFG